jgi:hypothetical protein
VWYHTYRLWPGDALIWLHTEAFGERDQSVPLGLENADSVGEYLVCSACYTYEKTQCDHKPKIRLASTHRRLRDSEQARTEAGG